MKSPIAAGKLQGNHFKINNFANNNNIMYNNPKNYILNTANNAGHINNNINMINQNINKKKPAFNSSLYNAARDSNTFKNEKLSTIDAGNNLNSFNKDKDEDFSSGEIIKIFEFTYFFIN